MPTLPSTQDSLSVKRPSKRKTEIDRLLATPEGRDLLWNLFRMNKDQNKQEGST